MTWILHGWITAKDYFHSPVRISVTIKYVIHLSIIFVGLNFHYFKQYKLRYLEKNALVK